MAETPPIGQEADTGVESCLVPPLPRRVSPCPSCFPLGNPGLGVAGNPKKQKLTLEPPVGAASWLPPLEQPEAKGIDCGQPSFRGLICKRQRRSWLLSRREQDRICLS